jgi:predicted MPP superfamily phosphohydrolase
VAPVEDRLLAAVKRRKGRQYSWRRPRHGEESHFELLISTRWTVVGLLGALLIGAGLAALPAPHRGRVARILAATTVGGAALALLEGVRGAAFPMLRRIDLPIERLPSAFDGLRIAQLTDLHLGMPLTGQSVRRAVAAVMEQQPDLIVLTGDYISYSRHLPQLRTALRPLEAPYGVYAVVGNHDHWTNPGAIMRVLDELGMQPLFNEHRVVAFDDSQLVIAGVDDMWDGKPDLAAALRDVPEGATILLLAHAPDYATLASRTEVAVQFAGHTHAGHIRLPWLGPLFLPRHGIDYERHLYRVGRMWLYVSHGVGGLPLRIGCRSEATVFTLQREQGPGDDEVGDG